MPGRESCEIAIVGAGPAGIAAACCAAESGSDVVVLDDNPAPGGQIWRGEKHAPWIARFRNSKARFHNSTRAVAFPTSNELLAERNGEPLLIKFEKLIIATGARELFLPFPGWTLPGVTGVGGLQALAQGGVPITGKRVVIAGSGPLLLAVASHLQERGARIKLIAEQATFTQLARFAAGLFNFPKKLVQAAALRFQLARVPYLTSAWPVEAQGHTTVESVLIMTHRGVRSVPCDYLACGFGLVPNTELAELAGCEIQDGFVTVDQNQRTSIANIFCAGEPTGIGGVEQSIEQGKIAGYEAAGKIQVTQRAGAHQFAQRLARGFELREELKSLATENTIVCRCETIGLGSLRQYSNAREAKLQTRCGMGPCQGRVCGPALRYLLDWPHGHDVRPPTFPVALETLAAYEPD